MNTDWQGAIHGYLDGVLTEDQQAALNGWLKEDPGNAALFAREALLHDRLRDVIRARQVIEPGEKADASQPRHPWRRASLVGGLAASVALALIVIWWVFPTSLNASTELERLIAAPPPREDRTYRITSLDSAPAPIEERQAPIDGAMLYVRPPNQYVLLRHFDDGRTYTTGFDGERNWSAPPDGPVRLSRDPMRFRSPLPGHQQSIPFADLRSDLVQLRDAYVVTLLKTDEHGWRGLQAVKKSPEYRGPRRVELWYDATTGVIHRMVFDGLPRARGGPNSVAVELVEQRDLGRDFFQHQRHHTPDRRVIDED